MELFSLLRALLFFSRLLHRFDLRAFRWIQSMMFAVDEINKNEELLPNISLGYKIMDSCASPTNVLRAAFSLVSEQKEQKFTSQCHLPLTALVAESGSSQSLAVAGMLGPFRVPMVMTIILAT